MPSTEFDYHSAFVRTLQNDSRAVQFERFRAEKGDFCQEREHFWTCRRVLEATIGQADFGFPVIVGSVVRDLAHNLSADQDAQTPAQATPPPYTKQHSDDV